MVARCSRLENEQLSYFLFNFWTKWLICGTKWLRTDLKMELSELKRSGHGTKWPDTILIFTWRHLKPCLMFTSKLFRNQGDEVSEVVKKLLVASCSRDRHRLWPIEPLGWYSDLFTFYQDNKSEILNSLVVAFRHSHRLYSFIMLLYQ